ncbi:hypothetical protein [Modicisalibacter sp. MOD 31.J]|uniref:hypothetical protein n=1 Tax=Modicisalibacter sp. MOD 31.J TaxID=2831897 RepID=UPI001CD00E7A|nr:hypothetical protein [Modicisalibacter sp. MOD 31.J]MBZ9574518.1 hypothetical protein [Modicisalibacter sp. MOD 31.J]
MIEIFNENGEVRDYLTVAERLPAFLEKYGPDSGYSIETRVLDYLGMHPELAELYRAALAAGASVSDLPAIDMSLRLFEAILLNSDRQVVAKASSLRRIDTQSGYAIQARAWESGETAALQRLAARLGFGSDTLLADEMSDMAERGTACTSKKESKTRAALKDESVEEGGTGVDEDGQTPASDEEAEVGVAYTYDPECCPSAHWNDGNDNCADCGIDLNPSGPSEPDSDPEPEPEEESQPEPDPAGKPATGKAKPTAVKKADSSAKSTSSKPAPAASGEVSEALLRQIKHLASVRGIKPPQVKTKAEAKEALKSLRATPAS